MENEKKQKIWETPLTAKNYKYYALVRYIGSERTWSCFFKTLKLIDKFKKYMTSLNLNLNDKILYQLFENIIQLLNDLSYYYPNEALTRLLFYSVKEEYFSNIKTLLEYKGLLYNQDIPEANISKIPFNIELIDKLSVFKKSLT